MTTGILNSINTKDRMYKLLLKTDTLTERYMTLKARFKTYREILRRSIKEAKKMYYQKVFNLYRNDIKKTWLTIKVNYYFYCLWYFTGNIYSPLYI